MFDQKLLSLLKMVEHLVLFTCLKLLPQLLDLLFHSVGLLVYALDPSDISFQKLIDKDFLIKFKSVHRFFKLLCFLVIVDTIKTENKDVWRIFHPVFIYAYLRLPSIVVRNFIAVRFFPSVVESAVLN